MGHLEIVLLSSEPEASSWSPHLVRVCRTDIPSGAFEAALERAARHKGYTARSHDAFVSTFLTSYGTVVVQDHVSPTDRIVASRLQLVDETQVAPLLVARSYAKSSVPLDAIPCGDPPVWSARVRRLELRVHRHATLVFETLRATSSAYDARRQVVRRVRVEIDLRESRRARQDELRDLSRTVENTLQVVLLAQTPRRVGAQVSCLMSDALS